MADIEAIKRANAIETVIGETVKLAKHGRFLRSESDSSFVVDAKKQCYFQNGGGDEGWGQDVIAWVMYRDRCEFKDAVEVLARRAKMDMPDWGNDDGKARLAARVREDALTVAARWMVRRMWQDIEAMDYARSRGWTDETIQGSGLGYTGHGTQAERVELIELFKQNGVDQESPGSVAIVGYNGNVAEWAKRNGVQAEMQWLDRNHIPGMPARMMVYPHVRAGRVRYLSARAIAEKRHYNLPASLVGERQAFFNSEWTPSAESVVITEGQADAVTLAQWGLAAVALAGTSASEELIETLRGNERRYAGLDGDGAGLAWTHRLCEALGPLTRIVQWPSKDANDTLKQFVAEGVADPTIAVGTLIDEAETYAERFCREAGQARGAKRETAMREAFELIAKIDEFAIGQHRKTLAHLLKLDVRQFNNLLKIALKEAGKEESRAEPVELVETVGGFIGGHLIELMYDPTNGETKFAARFPDGHLAITHGITIDNVRYIPSPPSSLMAKNVVLLPSEIGPELSLTQLHGLVRDFIHKYLDVEEFYESMAAYYVLLTWMYDCFENMPYLRALGDYGTGKTRFIQSIGCLCYRPMLTSGATTTSPIFRLLDRFKGTLILDEADFDKSDASADIMKILNTGYMRGMAVLRSGTEKNNFDPEAYDVYGPKILATRKTFVDKATESRCLTREMGGPTTRPIPLQLPKVFWEESLSIRNALLTYRLRNWGGPMDIDETLAVPGVEPRLNQVIMPLLMIVDVDSRKPVYRFVQRYARQMIVERSATLAAKVLQAMTELRRDNPVATLYLTAIAKRVNAIIDEEKDEDGAEEVTGDESGPKRQAKQVTPKGVGHMLRGELQIRTEQEKTGPKKRAYYAVWNEERIAALEYRYGLKSLPGSEEALGQNGNGHDKPAASTVRPGVQEVLVLAPEPPDVTSAWHEDWDDPKGLEFDR